MAQTWGISSALLRATHQVHVHPSRICCHLRGPALITSVSPKLTGKLGSLSQKASIWNCKNTNWFREKQILEIPSGLPREKHMWGIVCVLKCHVILGGDYLFVTSQQLPQQRDLHLWAVCCIRSEPWHLLEPFLVQSCEVWAQPPCHVSQAEILAPGSESCWVMQEDVRASSAFLVPALCRHHAGNWEAKTSCKCPFQLNLIGCGLSIRHFLKTLRSVPAALLHGQTGDDLRHGLRRDGPPHCHHQPSSITTSSVDAERLKCS